jgi:hypothetical protein
VADDKQTTRPALPFDNDNWRRRWLQFDRGVRLHRVSEIVWLDDERIAGHGVSVCDQRGRMSMPGILSRMGAPRCKRCCKVVGIPPGDGAPANLDTEWAHV